MVLGKVLGENSVYIEKESGRKFRYRINENKNKGSGKVYKMVGRMTGLTGPYVVSIIYICNKIIYKYKYIYIQL